MQTNLKDLRDGPRETRAVRWIDSQLDSLKSLIMLLPKLIIEKHIKLLISHPLLVPTFKILKFNIIHTLLSPSC
jgi:hypothetical protein